MRALRSVIDGVRRSPSPPIPRLRVSTRLVLIVLVLLAGAVLNGITVYTVERETASDTRTIDVIGVIRGSVQRIVKLETNGVRSPTAIAQLDGLINSFPFQRNRLYFSGDEKNFRAAFARFTRSWTAIKGLIVRYRSTGGELTRRRLLSESETAWQDLDAIMTFAQRAADQRLGAFFRYLLGITVADSVIFLLLLQMIRTYIRDELERLAQRDTLTGLWNRRSFDVIGQTLHAAFQRNGRPFAVIFFDLDHFKQINDRYGHPAGDAVLREVAGRVAQRLRHGDAICRIGGEEFSVLLPDTGLGKGVEVAESLRQAIAAVPFSPGCAATASFGVAESRRAETLTELIARTDRLLYQAKAAGRNRVQVDDGVPEKTVILAEVSARRRSWT